MTENQTITISEYLAAKIVNTTSENLPIEEIDKIKVLIRDYMGVCLRGAQSDAAKIVADYQLRYAQSPAESTIISRQGRVAAHGAAFANAVAAHSIELDDIDTLALFHFAPVVISAVLAAAESEGKSGIEVIVAIHVGCKVMQLLSDLMNPALRDRGFHTTPVCGLYGAIAGVSPIFDLSSAEIVNAFGIGGTQTGGLMEMYGPSMQKRLNPGPAAAAAVTSSRLAKLGYTGANTIFDGPRGLIVSYSGREDPKLPRDAWESTPVVVEYKPYACARPIHNAIDCGLWLRQELEGDVEQIRSLRLYRHPSWAHFHQIPNPRTHHEAQMSINHGLAVAIGLGHAGLEAFEGENLSDPLIASLRNILVVETDPDLLRGVSCRLEAELSDGSIISTTVDYPKGSIEAPMTEVEHRDKYERLTEVLLSQSPRLALRRAIESFEDVPNVREILALTQQQPGPVGRAI